MTNFSGRPAAVVPVAAAYSQAAEKSGDESPHSKNTRPIAALSTEYSRDPQRYFRTVAEIGVQIAAALDHAHEQGIIHRDIKPANLLLDRHGKPWITDFGLARLETTDGMTFSGALVGTFRYMSPEQARGDRTIDHRTDVYSLGITLYELTTLRPAFEGPNRHDVLRRIADEEASPPRRLNSQIPADLETIIDRAIEKEPQDRYATAGELAEDLRRFIEHETIRARPPSIWERTAKWLRRHSRAAVVAVVFLTLAVVGLGVSMLLVNRERSRAEKNLQLALSALDETLSEHVIGDLTGDKWMEGYQRELLRRGIKFYEQFANENGTVPTSWPTYDRLRRYELIEVASNLKEQGRIVQAEAAYKRAIEELEELAAKHPEDPEYVRLLAVSYRNYGGLLARPLHFDEAMRMFDLALEHCESLRGRVAPEIVAYEIGITRYNEGVVRDANGQQAAAEAAYRQALPLLQDAAEARPAGERYRHHLAMCQYNLGLVMANSGPDRSDEAQPVWEASLGQWRRLADEHPLKSEYHSRVGATLNNLAKLAMDRGDPDRARRLVEEAIAFQKEAARRKPVYDLVITFMQKHEQLRAQILAASGDKDALDSVAEQRAIEVGQ